MGYIVYNFPSVFVLYIHKTLLCPFIVHVYIDCPYKSSMVVRDVQETLVIPQRLRSKRNSHQDVLDSVSTQSTTPNLRKPFRHSVIAVTKVCGRT